MSRARILDVLASGGLALLAHPEHSKAARLARCSEQYADLHEHAKRTFQRLHETRGDAECLADWIEENVEGARVVRRDGGRWYVDISSRNERDA